MKISIRTTACVLVTFLFSFFSFLVSAITVSYDSSYDDPSRNLDSIACSDGTNGLLTKNYATQGSLPSFPRIGGASVIAGWNSENCGTCWTLTYNHTSINVLAIDKASQGFNIAKAAMDTLTGGHATAFGRVDANYTRAEPSDCRM